MASELALPYVPIDPRIATHPKTRRFLRALGRQGDPMAHAHLVFFLLAVGHHCPDGKLGNLDDADLADMGLWPGEPATFADAMRSSGWLQIGDGGYVVVGWEDYGGQVFAKREEFRAKQADNANRRWAKSTKTEKSGKSNSPEIVTESMPNDANPMPKMLKVKGEGEGEGEVIEKKDMSDANRVVAHYLQRYPKREKQARDQKTREKIKARLAQGYTPEQLCQAIDGNAASQFHVDGGFTALELIVRDAKHVDQFLDPPVRANAGNSNPRVGYHPGSPPGSFVDGIVNLEEAWK